MGVSSFEHVHVPPELTKHLLKLQRCSVNDGGRRMYRVLLCQLLAGTYGSW